MTTKYETGATSHAVNDLILFADNTKELVELRDSIYKRAFDRNDIISAKFKVSGENAGINALTAAFSNLLREAKKQYIKEFPHDHDHIKDLHFAYDGGKEFCQLYAHDFNNWKQENNIN